jgi:hypothetical protein
MRIASGKQAKRIACYVPDREQDSMPPLRAAGYPDQEIRSLDEVDI